MAHQGTKHQRDDWKKICSFQSCTSSSCICIRIFGSSAPKGSSINRIFGSRIKVAAIDTLISLARERICVFDVDLSQSGWNSPARADALSSFLRVRYARLDIIVHETAWIEKSCPRLTSLLRRFGHAMTIYKTGSGARGAVRRRPSEGRRENSGRDDGRGERGNDGAHGRDLQHDGRQVSPAQRLLDRPRRARMTGPY